MIAKVDQRLSEWIGSVLTEDIEVSLLPPRGMGDKKVVGLYLKDILPSAPTRGTRRPPPAGFAALPGYCLGKKSGRRA